jgi:hypothetical protein
MEELLKAQLHVRKQWLASAQSARERQKRRDTEQAEKYPEERQFIEIGFSKGLGNSQHLVFSIVRSLSTMSRSRP